jgi:hypothetical protein
VPYRSQQRGYPAIPLVEYTFADIERVLFTASAQPAVSKAPSK